MARWVGFAAVAAVGVMAGWPGGVAADPSPRERDEQAIRAASQAYMQAISQGDLAAAAALWTADGDIIDAAGNRILAAEIAVSPAVSGNPGTSDQRAGSGEAPADPANLSAADAAAGVDYRITETTLRFVGPDTAIEDGAVEIVAAVGPPLTGRFSATWVRQDGGWKLAAVREASGSEVGRWRWPISSGWWGTGSWSMTPRHPAMPVSPWLRSPPAGTNRRPS